MAFCIPRDSLFGIGVDSKQTKLVLPAALYHAGVANASDKGLDIWTNFGLAVQVKHLTLTAKIVEDVADDIAADKIVIVCLDKEKETIELLLKQVGWGQRIQGVITIKDLDDWYKLCLEKNIVTISEQNYSLTSSENLIWNFLQTKKCHHL